MANEKLCNYCGESLALNEFNHLGLWKSDKPHGLIDAKVQGGYESFHIFDLTEYKFSICEKCLRRMFEEFVIKPETKCYLAADISDPPYTYEKDSEYYKQRVWESDGSKKAKLATGICNATEECTNKAEWYHFTYYSAEPYHFHEEIVCEKHKRQVGSMDSIFFPENEAKKILSKQKMERALE